AAAKKTSRSSGGLGLLNSEPIALLALRGPCFRKIKFSYHLLAHHELLGLAGSRQRKFRNEPDVTRDLEMGHLALTEAADFLRRCRTSRLQNNERADFLAKPLVRDAEHLDRLHIGVLDQVFLDLSGIDILSAANEHVLDAANDVAKTLAIDHGEIAGMHPACAVDRFRRQRILAPIAAHYRIAARAKFANTPYRNQAAYAVDDFHFNMRMDSADCCH